MPIKIKLICRQVVGNEQLTDALFIGNTNPSQAETRVLANNFPNDETIQKDREYRLTIEPVWSEDSK